MIEPYDKNIEWGKKAGLEMTLISMVDLLFSNTIIVGYEERMDRGQPFPHYKEFYESHGDLLNDIVKIFFPLCNFVPCNINKQGTDEFYLFIVINCIFKIAWYYNIEDTKYKGYEKTKQELDKACHFISGYLDIVKLHKLIKFPLHKNETMQQLENMFIGINRPQQGEKVIAAIKEHFNIEKKTSTRKMKMINGNKRILDEIKKDYNLTDKELRQIPFLGQLQTKI